MLVLMPLIQTIQLQIDSLSPIFGDLFLNTSLSQTLSQYEIFEQVTTLQSIYNSHASTTEQIFTVSPLVSEIVSHIWEFNLLGDLYSKELEVEPQWIFGEHNMTDYVEYSIYMVERELERRHQLRPDLTKDELYKLWTGVGLDSCEYLLSTPILPTDYTNLFEHKGEMVDVAKLSHRDLLRLHWSIDDMGRLEKLESMACVRSIYQASVPHVKLYYPEPFIASPSFIHNDIGFIHILQYQYWLWFVFIFLIVFFFISFLCVARWCSMRNQPRRETRGVSRSKCGDLITACVPVSWALSIIISESNDAQDLYDGFGAGELIVGIRAYQWGWEYYYPKTIDLQYNVRPNYASFIGNSLKYTSSSEKTLNTNQLWKFYQNKQDDVIATPAHLLTLPLDNNKVFNFMDFKTIGADTAKESSAFRKIRLHSKVYNTNLVHTPTIFTAKYNKLNSLYTNENNLYDSLNYGLKRQHNLTSATATTNTYSTFLDRNSMDKFLSSNLQYNSDKQSTEVFNTNLNNFSKKNMTNLNLTTVRLMSILLESNNEFNSKGLTNLLLYPNLMLEINDNSEGVNVKLPIRKILNSFITKNDLIGFNSLTDVYNPNFTTSNTLDNNTSLSNRSITTKIFKTMSDNFRLLPSEQSVRLYSNLHPNKSNLNLSLGLNNLDSAFKSLNNSVSDTLSSTHFNSKNKWADSAVSQKLSSNSFFFESPYYPVLSNNPYSKPLSYDSTASRVITSSYTSKNKVKYLSEKTKNESVPILTGSKDGAFESLRASYWRMFWSNSNSDLRIEGAVKSSFNSDLSYLPLFTNYYDYDFRNAQALELLEDAFWDTSYSSYDHNDYLNISDEFNKKSLISPRKTLHDTSFYTENTTAGLSSKAVFSPVNKDLSLTGNFYANNIQFDDYVTPSNLVSTRDFFIFPLISSITTLDDTYTSYKNMLALYNKNSSFFLNLNLNYSYPQSYASVLNSFRADFDDFSWYVDVNNTDQTNKPSLSLDSSLVDETILDQNTSSSKANLSRYSNPITLRSTARNSIVTFNALRKVFKARYEDGRSNIKITDFGNLATPQPFITTGRMPYEKLLGKNKSSFYNTTFYKNNTFKVFNDLAANTNALNYYFFDFPFLMSEKSDPSRFVWFDWFSKWSVYEVQPSSSSRYSTIGAPYSKKNFEFNTDSNEKLQDSETYFIRIARARKNYLPNWTYTPYLYTRSNIWFKNDNSDLLLNTEASDINHTIRLLNDMGWFWNSLFFSNNTTPHFTPSISGNSIYGKSLWRPFTSISAYYYHTSHLVDLLTKREYVYRQFFERNRRTINLPNILTANPRNPLLEELKASFLFVDPINYNSEYSRELYYNSLSFFKFMLLKDWLISFKGTSKGAFINLDVVNDYLFYYFFNSSKSSNIGNNFELYKNQYRPLRKGISTMLRLHATGAVAMPTEIRLQILASSRDVIHSWSVPSAGIKIDCIPGYTSHRIMIFFNCGIYWGQCQEICGRYHHWMPIVVYFMKRDLFFLWCTHFASNLNGSNSWNINDRKFADYVRFASYDQHTWLTEIQKHM